MNSNNKEETNEVEKEEKVMEEEELNDKEEQKSVPSTTEKAEGHSVEEEKVENEEVSVANKQQSGSTPRKSRRLAFKGKRPVVILDDDSTSYTTVEPSHPSSPKPTTPSSHHFPSPPQSPIPPSPPPVHTSPNQGLGDTTVPTAPLFSILLKLNELQSRFLVFKDEICVSLASLSAQMDQMEARLGANLNTVEVETEYVDDEALAS